MKHLTQIGQNYDYLKQMDYVKTKICLRGCCTFFVSIHYLFKIDNKFKKTCLIKYREFFFFFFYNFFTKIQSWKIKLAALIRIISGNEYYYFYSMIQILFTNEQASSLYGESGKNCLIFILLSEWLQKPRKKLWRSIIKIIYLERLLF